MFYTLSSRLLVPPNTIFVTDHTTGYFVNVLPDWLIVILSLECYIVICIDWLYSYFTALCFSHVEVRFDISVIKELIERIDWLHLHQSQIQFFSGGREGPPPIPRQTRVYGAGKSGFSCTLFSNTWLSHCSAFYFWFVQVSCRQLQEQLTLMDSIYGEIWWRFAKTLDSALSTMSCLTPWLLKNIYYSLQRYISCSMN